MVRGRLKFRPQALTSTTLRGWLDSKYYPNATTGNPSTIGPNYQYWASGHPKQRTWVRNGGITTTYTYNNAGELATVSYSDGTPGTTLTYDRRGRQSTVSRNGITTTLGFNDVNELTSEAYSGGTLGGLTITSGYDTLLRRNSLSLNTQPSALNWSYGFDLLTGRLQTVADGPVPASANSATYFYVANSPLIDHIQFKNGANLTMTTTRQYDKLNRLSGISSVRNQAPFPGPAAFPFNYQYNSANQRQRLGVGDGSYWLYGYDKLGQVNSAKKYWSDGTPARPVRYG